MSPHRASSADLQQPASQIAAVIEDFLAQHAQAAVLEDGKVIFDLATAQHTLSTEHGRCTLHLWSEERNLVRRIVSATARAGTLRLATQRFGHAQTKLLEIVADRTRRTPTSREAARAEYLKLLEPALARHFDAVREQWKPEGFRSAMDLENSFGPAFTRGSLVRGNQACAVIGVGEQESPATIDGVLTIGILWLHACRERAGGKRLYQGLKVIVPRGAAGLTPSRLEWLNADAAQWELWEFDQTAAELTACDATGYGNLRTRLIHHPDEQAAAERFAAATARVTELVPATERHRVETRLRSNAELVFLLHGLEFARAQVVVAPNSFAQKIELTVGVGAAETPLTTENQAELAERIAELFSRRRAVEGTRLFAPRNAAGPSRRIGLPSTAPAHARLRARGAVGEVASDPLYRAAPERWLESMLRKDLAPLTRSLAPGPHGAARTQVSVDDDPDSIGNRADPAPSAADTDGNTLDGTPPESRAIPRLDPRHVYAQVPAIAGASDRGLLDLLGVTADGRLAVIELKAGEDMHFALQGLDYWIRVRHHHLQPPSVGMGALQRHGYFTGVELAPLPPRLYLVAPTLHIHPATEIVLRYLSPRVEWHLLALDERWRSQIRVVWRKHGGKEI
jgi:hypothetical protein